MTTTVNQELRSSARHANRFIFWILLALVVLFVIGETVTMFYTIKPNELGVVEVMGKVTQRRVAPGLHFKWPWPLSRVYRVPVKEVKRLVADTFFQGGDGDSRATIFYRLTGLESYCLTGDNNAVEIEAVIQYTISDPYAYIFGSRDQVALLRNAICKRMIHLLAVRRVDEILTYGKKEIEQQLRIQVQKDLDQNHTGISISMVEIKEIRPPLSVQSYFDDVINAQLDKKKLVSRAESYRNESLPAARADRDTVLRGAEAYRDQTIKAAQGETQRFYQKLDEYKKAPQITRQRLYLEFVRSVLGSAAIYLVESSDDRPVAQLKLLGNP